MLNSNFIIFVGLYLFTAVSHGLLARVSNKDSKMSPIKRAFIAIAFGTLPITIVISAFSSFAVGDTSRAVLFLGLGALCASLFHILIMTVLKHMTASRYQVMSGSYVVFAALLSLILGESLSWAAVLGIAVVVLGIGFVAYSKDELKSDGRKYDLLALLAALAVAGALVFQSKATDYASNGVLLVGSSALQALILGVSTAVLPKESNKAGKKRSTLMPFVVLGVLNGVIGLIYLLAQNNSSSIALLTTSTSLSIPLSAIAGILLLKERKSYGRKIVGSVLVFIGVVAFGLS